MKNWWVLFASFFLVIGCDSTGNNSNNEVPIYNWRLVGLFNQFEIRQLDYTEDGILIVTTAQNIFYSNTDGEYFNVLPIPDSVDAYKARFQNDEIYLVSNIFDVAHGTPWTGKTKMLYHKKDVYSNWEYVTGRYQLFDVVKYANTLFIGALNGVVTMDMDTKERVKTELFRSRLQDLVDDMLIYEGYVLASSHEGVFGTNNHGETWQDLTSRISKEYDHVFDMQVEKNNRLHAITASRVYVTDDANFEWQICYLDDSYDAVSLFDSDTYAVIDYKKVSLIRFDEDENKTKIGITPPVLREVDFRHFDDLKVSPDGIIFLTGEEGLLIGTPNPESAFWE